MPYCCHVTCVHVYAIPNVCPSSMALVKSSMAWTSSSPYNTSQTGNVSLQAQVLADGHRPTTASLWSNSIDGRSGNPSAGSASAPVAKRSTSHNCSETGVPFICRQASPSAIAKQNVKPDNSISQQHAHLPDELHHSGCYSIKCPSVSCHIPMLCWWIY